MQFDWTVQSQSVSSSTQTSKRMNNYSISKVLHPTHTQRALFYHFWICSSDSIGGLKMA